MKYVYVVEKQTAMERLRHVRCTGKYYCDIYGNQTDGYGQLIEDDRRTVSNHFESALTAIGSER